MGGPRHYGRQGRAGTEGMVRDLPPGPDRDDLLTMLTYTPLRDEEVGELWRMSERSMRRLRERIRDGKEGVKRPGETPGWIWRMVWRCEARSWVVQGDGAREKRLGRVWRWIGRVMLQRESFG
jgi:hypothetical protein